jgi:hypothetical protein
LLKKWYEFIAHVFLCSPLKLYQFKEHYVKMYGSTSALPHAFKKPAHTLTKHSMLMRELSDDEDESTEVPATASRNPWMDEFTRYYDVKDTVPDGMSNVQWWGVRTLTNKHLEFY